MGGRGAATVADLFIAGIDDDIGKGTEGSGAPAFEFGIKACSAMADVGGGDGGVAEFFEDGGDPFDFAQGRPLRVETPCTYLSARASLRACSLWTPFSRAEG